MFIRVGVSGRHIHLSSGDLEGIFGKGFKLTREKDLSLAGSFIARERLTLKGPKGEIPNVALVSTLRPQTQVEISRTDCHTLGIEAPVRLSGELDGTPGIVLAGFGSEHQISCGVIVPCRHIHMSLEDALQAGFASRDHAIVAVTGIRSLYFDNVPVKVSEINEHTEVHIDYDEANAAGLENGDMVRIFRAREGFFPC